MTGREDVALSELRPGRVLDRLAELIGGLIAADAVRVVWGDVVGVAGEPPVPSAVSELVAATSTSVRTSDAGAEQAPGGATGALLAVPLLVDGEAVGALCLTAPTGRTWTEADVALVERLGHAAAVELAIAGLGRDLEAERVGLGLAIDAAGIGSFDWDLATGDLAWDDRLIELFGYDVSGFERSIEAFFSRVHPGDRPRVTAHLQEVVETAEQLDIEYRVLLPDGATRWVAARGRPLVDPAGVVVRVLGAAYDTTVEREGEARVARVLESMSAAFYAVDRSWRFTYVNAEAERLLGRARGDLLGGDIWELFPAAVGTVFETAYKGALARGEPTVFEAYYPPPLDGWYELRVWPGPDGLSVYFLDITERRAAQSATDRASRRAELLTQVGEELAGTLDPEVAVARLARAVVPALAPWCVVSLLGEDGALRDVGWWHDDPDHHTDVQAYVALRAEAPEAQRLLRKVIDTGRADVLSVDAAARLAERLGDGGQEPLARLATTSAVVLPLRARGRTLGLLSLFWSDADLAARELAEHLVIGRDVATRAALALDNVRLFQQQRMLAEELQRSLLTPPPEPDHAQVVVRYVPASQAAQVGGDWYDAFLQADGATVVVIGDVVGHDTAAAGAMGQVRGLLRGIAYTTGDGPAEVLRRLDAAMEGLLVRTTATAVVLRIEQTPDERERGLTRLRWSNAGHPPPMIVHADGAVQPLTTLDADLLLGFDPTTARIESETMVDRGATVLLYTDGLIERRGQGLDEGLALLRDTLITLADHTLDDLCDEVLSRLLPEAPEDDVALVAVRLHLQDQPRPAEAGPRVLPPGVPAEPDTV